MLLAGSRVSSEWILSRVFDEFAPQIGQFRTEKHRTAFLIAKIRENVAARASQANETQALEEEPLAGKSDLPMRFSRLTEPSKSALALFYLGFFPVAELSSLLNLDLEDLAGLLKTGREQLGAPHFPVGEAGGKKSSNKAARLLACYLPAEGGPAESRIARAVKAARSDSALNSQLETQEAFDRGILDEIGTLEVPAVVLEGIESSEQPKERKSVGLGALKQPAFLSVGFAILVVLGVLLFSTYSRMNRFEGEEKIVDLLEATEEMSGVELEPKVTTLGNLGDWLFSKYAFENYRIPSEFSDYKTVGCRVFPQNGTRIAQIAVEPDNLIFFIFQPEPFGVKLRNKDGWRSFEQGDWAGAIRVSDGTCVMMALRGDKDDIEAVLAKLPKKK